jgi:hypothetical protein
MATSNNTVYQRTRDQLVEGALRKLGVLAEDQAATASQLATGMEALNMLLSDYESQGMLLWKRVSYDISLVASQNTYPIGIGLASNTAFPLDIYQATLTPVAATTNIDLEIVSNFEFQNLPDGEGTVVKVSYQPQINAGILSVWPSPATSGDQLTITYQKPLDRFTSSTETADVPQNWENALVYGLAHLLADEYQLPLEDRRWIEKQADKRLMLALSSNIEDASIFFYPDRRS